MKKVEHYICDVCGTEYAEKAKCQECEKEHKKAVSISKCRYLGLRNAGTGYPQSVTIKFDDGSEIDFKR